MGEKPRITLAQFRAMQQSGLTIAVLIERFITEMDGLDGRPPVRTLGESHRYQLRRHQREMIGQHIAKALTKGDVIAYARWRREKVCAATVMQDVTYLTGVLKYAGSAWEDCEDVSAAPIEAAKPFMAKHGLIAKSTPRERRPTTDELERLLAYFDRPERETGFRRTLDMVRMTLWQWYSAMRVGNSCQILWADWNREAQTILVRKMKDPKRRNKAKVVALTNQAQQMLIALETIRDPSEPRIHPYRAKSISASYTHAKEALGIEGLRLHDSRRDRGTRLVEDEGCSSAEAICFTGHETPAVFERTYLKQDAAKIVRQVNERTLASP